MEKIITIGLDLAKSIFQVHGIAGDGSIVVRRALRRSQVLDFFHSSISFTGPSTSRFVGVSISWRCRPGQIC